MTRRGDTSHSRQMTAGRQGSHGPWRHPVSAAPAPHRQMVAGWWIVPFFAAGILLWAALIWGLLGLVMS
jgi:hypothetical protein